MRAIRKLERRVAIKLVRAKESASRERILLEGQALAKLSHPNVVAVYGVGVVDDEVYLVMEHGLAAGRPLSSQILRTARSSIATSPLPTSVGSRTSPPALKVE